MCDPKYFDVKYEINPWMHLEDKPNEELSLNQWELLKQKLLDLGADLHFIDSQPKLLDMVYTANGGLIKGSKAVVPRFRHKERTGEEDFFESWFKENGFEVFKPKSCFFEGEGDALISKDTLFAGFGFRSEKDCYPEIADFLSLSKIVYCELINPYFYHLDTCFSPISSSLALIYKEAFSLESYNNIKNEFENIIDISKEDADFFSCNSVIVDNNIIMPNVSSCLEDKLNTFGYKIHRIPLEEFKKGGGASKCMSLKLFN